MLTPGTAIKVLTPVWTEPQLSYYSSMNSENFIKISSGSIGIIEELEITARNQTVVIVRFSKNLRARLATWIVQEL
jgi:hypothetical protein